MREVIGRRLDRLSERCNEVLTIAAVIGRQFRFEVIKRLVSDTTEGQLLDALDEALSARIVEELPDEIGLYQFTHAQMQETLTSELSANRTVRIHARIAEALEDYYGDEADEHASDLVEHFAEAETILGDDKMVHYSQIAGDRALASFAFDGAVTHFERALIARRDLPITEEIAALHYGAGVGHAALRNTEGSIDKALANLNAAFDYFAEAESLEMVALVARLQFVSQEGQQRMVPIMERALKLVPEDSIDAGWILATYGRAVGSYTDYQTGRDAFRRALAIAENAGDSALEMVTQGHAGYVDRFNLEIESAEIHEDRVIELSTTINNPLVESMSRMVRAMRHSNAGEREEAEAEAKRALEAAHRSGDSERMATVNLWHESAMFYYGEWELARQYGKTALEHWPRDPRALGFLVLIEFHVGDYAQGEAYVAQFRDLDSGVSLEEGGWLHSGVSAAIYPELARISGKSTYLEPAKQSASRLMGISGSTHAARLVGLTAMAWKAIWEADRLSAKTIYGELGPIGHVNWAYGCRLGYATLPGVLGLLAAAAGRSEEGEEHFASAIATCRTAGYRPYLAWTCSDYAEFLLDRTSTGSAQAESGDREKATELQDEAIAIATELGMTPLLERVLAQREILKA